MTKETIFFKRWLEDLDNEKFYYFARNFLPEVSTPYNQIEVIEQLISFFLNDENFTTMLTTIDEVDSLIIGLSELTGGINSSNILKLLRPFESETSTEDNSVKFYTYFNNNKNIEEFNYVEIIDHISSLVKRMILLSNCGKFILNPVFGNELILKGSLLPLMSVNCTEELSNENYISTEVLRGYLSLLKNEQKLTANQKKNMIPSLFPTYEEAEIIKISEIIDNLLLNLNIFTPFDSIEYELLQSLIDLTDFEFNVLLIINSLNDLFSETNNVYLFASELLSYAIETKIFDQISFTLLSEALSTKYNIYINNDFIDKLVKLSILNKHNNYLFISNIKKIKSESNTLVFDTDLSVRYLGTRAKGDILWRFTRISRLDTQTIYQLTKEDFRDALDSKLTKEKIYEFIIYHSIAKENCPALRYLDLVEQQYSQISIYDGIIIQGNERVSTILSSHPDLQSHIIKKLSDNIFLMQRDSEPSWTKIIENSGLLVPRRKGDIIQSDTFFTNAQWRVSKGFHLREEQTFFINNIMKICSSINVETKLFSNQLSNKTFSSKKLKIAIELLDCRAEEREDLKSRLQLSMIINKSQLSSPQVLDSNISASGFDYKRKVNVFKMASKQIGAIVKIGYMKHEFLLIVDKVQTLGNNEFSVEAKRLPTLEKVEIPINKIFFVKITNYITD
ncbi:MAG: hypothetical protein JJE21_02010 [Spirochaetaceae bacterium]|nr:hypothetical protein [Spirochaetaceae bacterium]